MPPNSKAPSSQGKWLIFAVAALLLALTVGVIIQLKNQQVIGAPGVKVGPVRLYGTNGNVVAEESVLLPEKILDATSQPGLISSMELTGLPKDTTFGRRDYRFPDNFEARMSVVLMKKDRSSIHQPQFCLVGQGWSIDKTEVVPIRIDRPVPYDLPTMKLTTSIRVKNQGQTVTVHGLYVYWFVAKDKLGLGQSDRTWSMLKASMTKGVLERWAYISCFAKCLPGKEDETFERMKQLIAASVPEFQLATGKPLNSR